MADLTDIQAAQAVKITGANSTGVEGTPVNSTSNGGMHVNLRDNVGTEFGTETNPIYTSGNSEILSPLPGFVARANSVVSAGTTVTNTYTMTDDIALVDFHFGGRGIGQASLFRCTEGITEQLPGGGFNSSGDVSQWTNAGIGSSSGLTWSYTTAQQAEGTGSATTTFTQSDSNNFPAIKYTYSTPKNMNTWRYISAKVRVTVAAGGVQTRTVSIILTDIGGNTRTFSVAGTTTTAPFSTEQWVTILGEIENPTATVGTFDIYNVASVTLKLLDGGNKAGTIYWDDIEFVTSQELIERIYIEANSTFQLVLNPAELFDIGEVLCLQYKNNDATSKEFTVTAKGVVR
jgi:hypothetical protein